MEVAAGVVAGAGPEAEQAEGGGVAHRLGLISLCQRGRGTSLQTLPCTCRAHQRCYTRRWSRESGRVLKRWAGPRLIRCRQIKHCRCLSL